MNGVRGSLKEILSTQDAEFLCSFHIDNKDHFNLQDKQQTRKDALFLYATIDAKNVHNDCALKEVNTEDNPVAIIKAQTRRFRDNTRLRYIGHYDNE